MLRDFDFFTATKKFKMLMELDPRSRSDMWIVNWFDHYHMPYEAEVSCLMANVLREGDVAIDVGANVGFFSILMSNLVGPTGKVLAFEPDPVTLPALRRNLGMNDTCSNVKLVDRPLWCREEQVTLWHDLDSGGGGSALWDAGLWPENERSRATPQPHKLMATTLDQHAIDLMEIRLIKLDTEGTEKKILEGATKVLTQIRPPFIVTELNPFGLQQMGCSPDLFRKFMGNYGYSAFLLHQSGALPTLVPSKTKIAHARDIAVLNVLFSTVEAVGEAWPSAPMWGPND